VRDGRLYPLPAATKSLVSSRMLSWRDKAAVAMLLGRLPKLDSTRWVGRTVDEWLDAAHLRGAGRDLAIMLVRTATYANAPGLLDAGAAIDQVRSALAKGVLYLDRGWQQLIDGLAAAATGVGADIAAATAPVASVQPGMVTLASGDGIEAGAIVVAVGGPEEAARLLGIDASPWRDTAGPAVEAAVLDLGLSRVPDPPVVFGVGEPLYLSTHCPPADLAPPGHALVTTMRYLAPNEESDPAVVRSGLVSFAEMAGIRGDDIVHQRYLHRLTVAHGMPLATRGGLAGRPPVEVPGVEGVFVAGDWVGARGMLADAALASAEEAARSAVRAAKPRTTMAG
jgi:phytoene dehydrogenase-like protein